MRQHSGIAELMPNQVRANLSHLSFSHQHDRLGQEYVVRSLYNSVFKNENDIRIPRITRNWWGLAVLRYSITGVRKLPKNKCSVYKILNEYRNKNIIQTVTSAFFYTRCWMYWR
jgi:hypothetical protein